MSDGAWFDPLALDRAYLGLDDLPRQLWLQTLVNGRGLPASRLLDVLELRRSLLAGHLPEDWLGWPLPPATAAFAEVFARLGLSGYSRGDEAVADEILQTWLWHVDRIADYRAEHDETAAVARAAESFAADWISVRKDIEAVRAVFEILGDSLKTSQWATIRGLLRSEGWAELLRIRRLLEGLPELGRLIRQLGRSREVDEIEERAPPFPVQERVSARRWLAQEIQVPGMVAETLGVRRGGELGRLLPAELVMLRLPRMRLSWFARLAERALLAYEDVDRVIEKMPQSATEWRQTAHPVPQRRTEMGPMVLCVDTSASMQGGAEQVAKAVVLEAMRTAAAQGRRCHVFAFGGPGEIVERELPLDFGGIAAVLEFMGQSFQGGTDISEPLERALDRIARAEWMLADLLIASDGEFGATPALARRLAEEKTRLGVRVQGVLIGDRETMGMRQLCDGLLWVRDWRRFGGSGAQSPVHDKSLTALYFPGALKS